MTTPPSPPTYPDSTELPNGGLGGCPEEFAGCLTVAGAKKLNRAMVDAVEYSRTAWRRCKPKEKR